MMILIKVMHSYVFNTVFMKPPNSEVIQSFRPLMTINQHIARAIACREALDMNAKFFFDLMTNCEEILPILYCGHHCAIAIEIRPESIQLNSRKILDQFYGIADLIIFSEPDPFAQITHINH